MDFPDDNPKAQEVKALLEEVIRRKVDRRLEEERRQQLLEDYQEEVEEEEYEGRFSDCKILNLIAWSLYIVGLVILSPILIPWKVIVFMFRPFRAAFRRLR